MTIAKFKVQLFGEFSLLLTENPAAGLETPDPTHVFVGNLVPTVSEPQEGMFPLQAGRL